MTIKNMRDLQSAQSFLEAKIEQKEEILRFQFKVLKSVYSPRNIVNSFIDDLTDTLPMVDLAIKGYNIASAIIRQFKE